MKTITKITKYWFFKPVNENTEQYFYIRSGVINEDNEFSIFWFIGYENSLGNVSSVGGEIDDEMVKQLEYDFNNNR